MIKLNAIQRKDLETIRQWRNQHRRYFRQFYDLTEADQEKWFISNYRGTDIMFGIYETEQYEKPASLNYKDFEKIKDKNLIGVCGLTYIDYRNGNADLSIYLDNYIDDRALEALKLLYKYGFEELRLERIYNDLYCYDTEKEKILFKSGMQKEGILRHRYYRDGKYYDANIYSVIKNEYMNKYDEETIK